MERSTRLDIANMNYGNCCLRVYDSCNKRRTPVAIADQLLSSVTRAGGLVEDLIISDNEYKRVEVLNEINRARYTAKLLYENNCCSDRIIRRFIAAANDLEFAVFNPEPEKKKKKVDKKPKKVDKKRAVYVNYDPDGFDDIYVEPKTEEQPKGAD